MVLKLEFIILTTFTVYCNCMQFISDCITYLYLIPMRESECSLEGDCSEQLTEELMEELTEQVCMIIFFCKNIKLLISSINIFLRSLR